MRDRRLNHSSINALLCSLLQIRTAKENWTVLHLAAIHGQVGICNYFVSQHRSSDFINARDSWGYTPLHYACDNGDTAVVCCLLEARADRYVRSDDGQPLMPHEVANITGHANLVSVLLLNQRKPVVSMSLTLFDLET